MPVLNFSTDRVQKKILISLQKQRHSFELSGNGRIGGKHKARARRTQARKVSLAGEEAQMKERVVTVND